MTTPCTNYPDCGCPYGDCKLDLESVGDERAAEFVPPGDLSSIAPAHMTRDAVLRAFDKAWPKDPGHCDGDPGDEDGGRM